jgi:hypothetical protein
MPDYTDLLTEALVRDRQARLHQAAAAARAQVAARGPSGPLLRRGRLRAGQLLARVGRWAVRHGHAWAREARRAARA